MRRKAQAGIRDVRERGFSEDGVVMAVEHRTLPVAAVQFDPESILTLGGEVGRASSTRWRRACARRQPSRELNLPRRLAGRPHPGPCRYGCSNRALVFDKQLDVLLSHIQEYG